MLSGSRGMDTLTSSGPFQPEPCPSLFPPPGFPLHPPPTYYFFGTSKEKAGRPPS